MRFVLISFLSALALTLGARPSHAQQTRVVPWGFLTQNGNQPGNPFDKGRFQQLIEGQTFCSTWAQLQEIAFRRDDLLPMSYSAQTLPAVTVRVGHTTHNAASLSLDLASNWGPLTQTVFQGSYNLPANPFVASGFVHPFNVVIKFARPFFYLRRVGNLLFEIDSPQTPPGMIYLSDGFENRTRGTMTPFGSGGQFASQERHDFTDVGRFVGGVRIGRTVGFHVFGLRNNYPTLVVLGASRSLYGSLRLPFDLTALGAPGNQLHVSLDALAPLALRQMDGWSAKIRLSIPPDTGLANASFYLQLVSADPRANRLGLVWSSAFAVWIAPHHPIESIYAPDGTSKTARYFAESAGGVVVRLSGSQFN